MSEHQFLKAPAGIAVPAQGINQNTICNIASYSTNFKQQQFFEQRLFDMASISKTWDWLYQPGHCVEMRCIGKRGEIIFGYFSDKETFTKKASELSSHIQVYAIVNPVPLDFLGIANNRLYGNWKAKKYFNVEETSKISTAKDEDILYESLAFIDIDCKRNPKETPANDDELAKGLVVAQKVKAYLESKGLAPLLACSGNGFYVLCKLPMNEFTPERIEKRKHFLQMLDNKFSNEHAEIDTKVYNPARLMKVIGTMSIKGENVPEIGRIHRLSRYLP